MKTVFKTLPEPLQLAILASLYSYGQNGQADRQARIYWLERYFSVMQSLITTTEEERLLVRAYNQGRNEIKAA